MYNFWRRFSHVNARTWISKCFGIFCFLFVFSVYVCIFSHSLALTVLLLLLLFLLSSFWNIPVTFKMALKYYSCLSEMVAWKIYLFCFRNLLVYVKVCGLASDSVRVHDLRADDIVQLFQRLSFLVVWLLNDASPYNFRLTIFSHTRRERAHACSCVCALCINVYEWMIAFARLKSWWWYVMRLFARAIYIFKGNMACTVHTFYPHCSIGRQHLIVVWAHDDKEMIFGKNKHAYTIKNETTITTTTVWFFHECYSSLAAHNQIW